MNSRIEGQVAVIVTVIYICYVYVRELVARVASRTDSETLQGPKVCWHVGCSHPGNLKPLIVDAVDDVHVAGQQLAQHLDRPLLQRLGQHRVIGVR